MKRLATLVIAALGFAAPLLAQTSVANVPPPVSLSGPRMGVTFINDEAKANLAAHDVIVSNALSQFGWQFEKRFYTNPNGLHALNEWVVLFGGLDQGVMLPSLNWLAGLRTREGAEFGIGPNFTPLGVGLVVAAGTTFKAGSMNVPVNVAIVPSKTGVRYSVMTGFNFRR
ncbi:MAG TPA: hypothetical protein VJP86_02070 [Vicinamibacterales bacterium]|jgi:hypothetical protein|nr:hypothetical protein [Vicinamibacterales bacterium]